MKPYPASTGLNLPERAAGRWRSSAMIAALPATPPASTTALAAADVVRDYYAAIERRDYRRAYGLWSGGHSYAAFVRGYRHTSHVRIRFLPPFETEGAAGSSYATIGLTLTATLDSGRIRHFTGSYTLRRVNDVDGSSAAQRRWHIDSAKLTPR